ncbi:MAG: ribbon-helix-helix protein, CopG family [Candidatus Blackburnbacteria bacterium]|nr:ribbon-helix-helix protein, CopG family [Candidatus Blackburnbacteria bacterium]
MATVTISLPTQVAKKVDSEARKQGFATRSEFVRSLLRKHFAEEVLFETYTPRPLQEVRLELAKTGKYSEKFIDSLISGLSKSSSYGR